VTPTGTELPSFSADKLQSEAARSIFVATDRGQQAHHDNQERAFESCATIAQELTTQTLTAIENSVGRLAGRLCAPEAKTIAENPATDDVASRVAIEPLCGAAGVSAANILQKLDDAARLAVCILDSRPPAVRWHVATHLCRDFMGRNPSIDGHSLDPILGEYLRASYPPSPCRHNQTGG
jgi:hypothetical protein